MKIYSGASAGARAEPHPLENLVTHRSQICGCHVTVRPYIRPYVRQVPYLEE